MGLCTAMLLANDGHEVTVLERDTLGSPDPRESFESWERRGVNQFRLPHFFLSKFREIIEVELPSLPDGLAAAGALSFNALTNIPDEMKDGTRPGDVEGDSVARAGEGGGRCVCCACWRFGHGYFEGDAAGESARGGDGDGGGVGGGCAGFDGDAGGGEGVGRCWRSCHGDDGRARCGGVDG